MFFLFKGLPSGNFFLFNLPSLQRDKVLWEGKGSIFILRALLLTRKKALRRALKFFREVLRLINALTLLVLEELSLNSMVDLGYYTCWSEFLL
mmetsp:Transcript_23932/g.23614  ORF Transcript_23932/g.23614 Transcript_23932/m.23614 type:complete len:93 (+) Transcript_23932:290-568(+)